MQTTTNPKSLLSELSDNNNEPSWLLEKRQNALKFFQDTPMPSFIYGLNINLKIDLDLSDLDTSKSSEIKKEIINKNNTEIFAGLLYISSFSLEFFFKDKGFISSLIFAIVS